MSKSPDRSSRREFIRIAAATAAAVAVAGVLPLRAEAAELPHLDPSEPAAQALGYVPNTDQVSQAKYPNHKTSQNCANCSFFVGSPGAAWGPCQLFPGKAVNANGWCSAHAPKK